MFSKGFSVIDVRDPRRPKAAAYVPAADAAAVRVGRTLELSLDVLTGVFAPDGTFLALYEPSGDTARPVAVFV